MKWHIIKQKQTVCVKFTFPKKSDGDHLFYHHEKVLNTDNVKFTYRCMRRLTMKFGASTFIWVSPFGDDSLDLFQKVGEMGFDTLEVCVESPETINVEHILTAAKTAGVDVIICGAFGPTRDISSTDAAVREEGLNYIKTCIDIAFQVGSKLVSGPMYAAVGKTNLLTPDEKQKQWDFAVKNMKEAALYAQQFGVKLAFEPLNRFETDMINTVAQGLDLIGQIDMENVGMLIDTFHMNIEEKNIADAIRLAGDRVFNFHACANDRGTPGEDHINWKEVKQALQDIQYDGHVVIEAFNSNITEIAKAVALWRPLASSPDALASNGIKFLKELF